MQRWHGSISDFRQKKSIRFFFVRKIVAILFAPPIPFSYFRVVNEALLHIKPGALGKINVTIHPAGCRFVPCVLERCGEDDMAEKHIAITDPPVTSKALRKRQQEFEADVVPHKAILYNFALRTTGNADDAKDLLQETFLKAFRFWRVQKGHERARVVVPHHETPISTGYRKKRANPGMVDYEDIENFYDSIRDESTDSNDLQRRMYSNMLGDEVTEALQSLPEDFRTVVILADIEGLSYEEIADFLNCPVGTVRSRLHRGRKMLQDTLHDYAHDLGIINDGEMN